jgi:fructokinase
MRRIGGIEAGGTKFVCAVGSGPADLHRISFPTTTPDETISRAIDFFRSQPVEAIGIACFGPIDLATGIITTTPKPGWQNTAITGPIAAALGVPVGFDTDVNGAALGEARWGAGQGLSDLIYITIGTGIGGGAITGGRPVHGKLHPEVGHIRIPRHNSDEYKGYCRFHGDCLEGLACGKAMEERWGAKPEHLPEHHPAWVLEAHYLAHGIVNVLLTLSPQRIILGGGVTHHAPLFPMIRNEVRCLLNGYLDPPDIVPPALGDDAGVLGAIALGMAAATPHCNPQ